MNLIRYFDPGRPGSLRRTGRVAVGVVLVGSCLAATVIAAGLRTEVGRFALVAALSEADLYPLALPLAHDLRVDYPTSNWHYYRLEARNLRRLGRHAESLAVYDKAIEALPEDWWAHSHRCFYGALLGDARTVMDSCDRQIALGPSAPDVAYDRRGVARLRIGDLDGAQADLRRAVDEMRRLAPNDWRLAEREAWIAALEAGANPLTPEAIREELSHY